MRSIKTLHLQLLGGLVLFLSSIALLINHFVYQYSGNQFFPEGTVYVIVILLFIYQGLVIVFGKDTRPSNSSFELINLFAVMSLIAFTSNAVQLTPFAPIDIYIINFESYFNINFAALLEWTNKQPHLNTILWITYNTLPYQMSILPLCVIISGRFYRLREYYFLMLFTTLIGFTFYYFFPTTAPASNISSPLFVPEQYATGLKFNQIHQHIIPTTNQGGLIALPSFHSIWALLCIYLVWEWFYARILLIIINSLLVISCVLLGWHYPTDVVAALLIVWISVYFLKRVSPY